MNNQHNQALPQKEMPITVPLDYRPKLSINATANRANIALSLPQEEDMEEYTDEDESLPTPMSCTSNYIHYDLGDNDACGLIGSLERGWSDMLNEM